MSNNNGKFVPNIFTTASILLASTLILMGAAAVAPALHSISVQFPENEFVISMIISLPALSVAIFGFPMGMLADRIGMAKTFILSLAIFTVTGTMGYFASTIWELLAYRFLLGIGIAGIATTSTALIGMYYSGMKRMQIIGLQSAAMGIGCLILETLGGVLADIGWKEPFLVYLIGIPIILVSLLGIRDIEFDSSEYEYNVMEMDNNTVKTSKLPILFCYSMIFMSTFMMFIIPTNISEFLAGLGTDMTVVGLLLGLMGIAQGITSTLYSRLKERPNQYVVYTASFIVLGVALALLYAENVILAGVCIALVGVGMGIMIPTVVGELTAIAMQGNDQGKIMGGYSMAMNLGNFVSAILVTILITSMGYTDAFITAAIVSVVIGILVQGVNLYKGMSVKS
ncbi:MAG: MFS transporter [Thermoplasmata archaeon]|nr:MFS transporter [Thermoplasmata archaeon]